MNLFPTLQKLAPRANLIYSCYPAYLTKNAPSQFQNGSAGASYYQANGGNCPDLHDVVCWQRFTGTDPITGFAYPNAAPLFAINGGSQEGFGVYVTDQEHGLGAHPGNQTTLDATVGITNDEVTVRGVAMNALHVNHYNHFRNGYFAGEQSHFMIYRNTAATGFADLETICFDFYMKVPDQSAVLSQTYKFRTIHDFKTTNDFRYAVHFIRADATDADAFGVDAGTVGLLFTADNFAGNITPVQEFIRVKNYNVNIPSGFYKATLYWHRSTAYDDVTTGRFVYIIKDLDTGEETTVFDINPDFIAQYNIDHPLACTNNGGNPATNCVNRHMGITGNAWQRLFMLSNYHGGLANKDVEFWLHKIDIWDDAPFDLATV